MQQQGIWVILADGSDMIVPVLRTQGLVDLEFLLYGKHLVRFAGYTRQGFLKYIQVT